MEIARSVPNAFTATFFAWWRRNDEKIISVAERIKTNRLIVARTRRISKRGGN